MPADMPSLEEVRREIDAVDDVLLDALVRRAALIERVIAAKRDDGAPATAMRPGREAMILRRIGTEHRGKLPPAVVLRVWREIVNAATAMQGPIAVAVCAPEKSVGYWDLARNHFGAATAMTLHVAPSVVLRRVMDRPGTIGVLPEPRDEDDEPWWVTLASGIQSNTGPKIIWRLPFYASVSGRFEDLSAFAIACMEPERTDNDITIAVFECDVDVSRARLLEALTEVGLSARVIGIHEVAEAKTRLQLVLIDGFLTSEDRRLEALRNNLGELLLRSLVLGAYPEPLSGPGVTTDAES